MNRWTRHLTRLNSADLLRFGSFNSQIQSSSPRFSMICSFATNSGSRRSKLRGEVAVTGGGGEPERKELPEEISRSVLVLTCESTAKAGSCRVYLVGTRHLSQESVKKVQAVIRTLKPEIVFLELCSLRKQILTSPKFKDSESRVAFEEAIAYGAKAVLGDRPIQITGMRTLAKMTFSHIKWLFRPRKKIKWLTGMDDFDVLAPLNQQMSKLKELLILMEKEFPAIFETIVHERDKYMSSKLLEVASEHSSVVAVVDSVHLPGIKKHWKQPVELKELLDDQSSVLGVKYIKSLGVIAAIISGIYFTFKK